MKDYKDTLRDVIKYATIDCDDLIGTLFMMGFTPYQLINDFDFDEEAVTSHSDFREYADLYGEFPEVDKNIGKLAERNNKPYEVEYTDMFENKHTVIPKLELYSACDILTGEKRPLIAIQLYSVNEEMEKEPFAMLTVNFGEYICIHNAAYIDTNNLGSKITDWLEKIGAGHKTNFTKQSGFCKYPLFVFNDEFLSKIEDNGQNLAKYNESFEKYTHTFLGFEPEDEPDITDQKE